MKGCLENKCLRTVLSVHREELRKTMESKELGWIEGRRNKGGYETRRCEYNTRDAREGESRPAVATYPQASDTCASP